MKYGTSRALVIWDRKFPTIGTFCEHTMETVSHGIAQTGPWVTVADALGNCVGNVATEETTFSNAEKRLIFPCVAADTVNFAGFHDAVKSQLVGKEMRTGKETQFDHETAFLLGQQHKEWKGSPYGRRT